MWNLSQVERYIVSKSGKGGSLSAKKGKTPKSKALAQASVIRGQNKEKNQELGETTANLSPLKKRKHLACSRFQPSEEAKRRLRHDKEKTILRRGITVRANQGEKTQKSEDTESS